MKKVIPQMSFDFGAPPELPPGPPPGRDVVYAAGVGIRIKSLKKPASTPEETTPEEKKPDKTTPEKTTPEKKVPETGKLWPEEERPESSPGATLASATEERQEYAMEASLESSAEARPASATEERPESSKESSPGSAAERPTPAATRPYKPIPSKRGRKSLKQIAAEADLIEIPADEILFQKQYYTMGEVAKMFRVNQSLLRFWEAEFDILQPRKNKKGDRYFRPVDIKNLHLIYHLLRQRKYTIEGAKEFLKKNTKGEERFIAIQRLQEIKSFLLELKSQL